MYQEITVELQFFIISVLWGGIVLLAYDGLRIIRRLIKHGTFFLAVEDLIFWIIASVFIFSMIYRQNNGIIRGFSVMGMTLGILIYHYAFKNIIVNILVKCICTLLLPVSLAFKAVKRGLLFILSKVKKAVNFLIRQLKKLLKSVKISMNKKSQALAAERKKRLEKRAALRKARKRKPGSPGSGKKQIEEAAGRHPSAGNEVPVYRREHTLILERVNTPIQVRKVQHMDNSDAKLAKEVPRTVRKSRPDKE